MKKYNLTSDIILNKKFPTELSGYNATEVDKYLDLILEDYNNYDDHIKIIEAKIEEKVVVITNKDEEIMRLKLENENLKTQIKESAKMSNFELGKKLDLLIASKNKDE